MVLDSAAQVGGIVVSAHVTMLAWSELLGVRGVRSKVVPLQVTVSADTTQQSNNTIITFLNHQPLLTYTGEEQE